LHATSPSPYAPPWPARLVYSCWNCPGNCCRHSRPPWPSRPLWPATSEFPPPKPATPLPSPARVASPEPFLQSPRPSEHRLQHQSPARTLQTLHARVAGWSWDASGQATTTGGYARAPGCFPASPSPLTSINRPEPSLAGASSAQKSRPGASRQNRSFFQGPKCEDGDSGE
jgi:hypothetical protein